MRAGAIMAAGAAVLCVAPGALAEGVLGSDVTVTLAPRWQRIRLEPDVNPVSAIDMNVYGISADIHRSRSPIAFSFDLRFGEAEETDEFRITDLIERDARFVEADARLEYVRMDSPLVVLFGARYREAEHSDSVVGAVDGAFSTQTRMLVGELGLRLVGQPSPHSDHVIFAQGSIGLGVGETETVAAADSSYGRVRATSVEGLATSAEIAFGWSYYFTENASIGARMSGQAFGVELFDDGEPVYAWGPELSGSWSF